MHLNQRFLMTYTALIFVCVDCTKATKYTLQPTFFNGVFTAYLSMRGLRTHD